MKNTILENRVYRNNMYSLTSTLSRIDNENYDLLNESTMQKLKNLKTTYDIIKELMKAPSKPVTTTLAATYRLPMLYVSLAKNAVQLYFANKKIRKLADSVKGQDASTMDPVDLELLRGHQRKLAVHIVNILRASLKIVPVPVVEKVIELYLNAEKDNANYLPAAITASKFFNDAYNSLPGIAQKTLTVGSKIFGGPIIADSMNLLIEISQLTDPGKDFVGDSLESIKKKSGLDILFPGKSDSESADEISVLPSDSEQGLDALDVGSSYGDAETVIMQRKKPDMLDVDDAIPDDETQIFSRRPNRKKSMNERYSILFLLEGFNNEVADLYVSDDLGVGDGPLFEKAKPDFLDLDGDGNKKETMKKAAKDKKKNKSKDEMHHHETTSEDLEEFSSVGSGAISGYMLPLGQSNKPKSKQRDHHRLFEEQLDRILRLQAFHQKTTNRLK